MDKSTFFQKIRLQFINGRIKKYIKRLFTVFGTIISTMEIVLICLNWSNNQNSPAYGFIQKVLSSFVEKPLSVILVLSVLFFLIVIFNRVKFSTKYSISNTNIEIEVVVANLLEQDGLKIIHSTDTFDSQVDTIVRKTSLHGQFLLKYNDRINEIDQLIESKLKCKTYSENLKLPGKTKVYPLGTICILDIEEESYCLLSFSHLKENNTLELSLEEYQTMLLALWANLSKERVDKDEVNIAILGNRFIDFPATLTTEQKIIRIVQSFIESNKRHQCCRKLRICVSEKDMFNVDFEKIHDLIEFYDTK